MNITTLQDEHDKTYDIFTALNDIAPPNTWKMTPLWAIHTILVTKEERRTEVPLDSCPLAII